MSSKRSNISKPVQKACLTNLLYGKHACYAALKNPQRKIDAVWVTKEVFNNLSEMRFDSKVRMRIVDRSFLDSLFEGFVVHQGIVIHAQPLQWEALSLLQKNKNEKQIVLLLDQVTDPQNVGSILRTCRVFDVAAFVMTTDHAPPETGAMAKVASGALEAVSKIHVTNLASAIRQLKKWGFWVVGLTEHGTQSLRQVNLRGRIALVMGSEGHGMRSLTEELCDFRAFLPTSKFSTLNVTQATSIALYEAFLQNQG